MVKLRRSLRVLFESIRKNDKQKVLYLLRHGARANRRDLEGNSTVHHAIMSKADDVEMVNLLLGHGARADLANYDGLRPYDLAFQLKSYKCLEFLLKFGVRINVGFFGDFLHDVPQNIVDLHYQQVNVKELSHMGLTALHHTVRVNDLNGVKMLIRKGANVNHQELLEGSTPLYWARTAKCVEILLRHGAKPDLRHKWGHTLLFSLCRHKIRKLPHSEHVKIVELLLEYGADVREGLTNMRILIVHCGWRLQQLAGLKILLKCMAKLEHLHAYADNKSLRLTRKGCIRAFYIKCLKELEFARKERIYGEVTYFDVLTKKITSLASIVRNKCLVRAFDRKKRKCRLFFPIYHKCIVRRFKEAVERNKLMGTAAIVLSMAMKCVDARHVATQKILDYLYVDDLENLTVIHKSLKKTKAKK